jgi:hypothetical protein
VSELGCGRCRGLMQYVTVSAFSCVWMTSCDSTVGDGECV